MNRLARGEHEDQRQNTCAGPDGRIYNYDLDSGIYKLQCGETESVQTESDDPRNRVSFWTLKVRRKWFILVVPNLIALGTLLVVTAYTRYAAEQVEISENANYNFMKSNRDSGRALALTLHSMEMQLKQTQRSADAAASAAKTAKSALESAKKEAVIENRPILWVTSDLGAPSLVGGTGVTWEWHITNYGKTPALDVTIEQVPVISGNPSKCWRVAGEFLSDYGKFSFPAPITPNRVESVTCVFSPGSFGGKLGADTQSLHYKGQAQIKITLRYKDVYSSTHKTFICLQNAGYPSVPESKGEFCETPKSQIDSEKAGGPGPHPAE